MNIYGTVHTFPCVGEMRLSYMKLNERINKLDSNLNERIKKLDDSFNGLRSDFNKYAQRNDDRANNHETRLVRLEEKTSGNSYIAREPAGHYKRKKRK